MDDIRRIDNFLALIANACKNGEKIDSNVVYSNLVYYGIDKKRDDISFNFKSWEDYYYRKRNMFCFNPPDKRYFCYFLNDNKGMDKVENFIKLYISLDKEHIYKGAIKIFDFLSRENITHESKIGSHVRIDDLVIRVDGIENAEKVINFINNDKYIKFGALQGNPFAFKDGVVSMAWDGMLSYNKSISSWISQYINWEFSNSNLSNVSYSRLYSFVSMSLNNVMTNNNDRERLVSYLMQEKIIDPYDKNASVLEQLNNYLDITRLFIKAISIDKSKKDLYEFSLQNKQLKKEDKNKKVNLDVLMYDEKQLMEKREFMKLAFDNMVLKYGYEGTKARFCRFLVTGDYNCISRHMNARQIMIQNGVDNVVAKKIVNSWKSEALDQAIEMTYQKYGYDQVKAALFNLLRCKNFSNFTNDNNSRNILIDRFSDGDVISVMVDKLKNNEYDVLKLGNEELCELYLEKVLQKSKKIA